MPSSAPLSERSSSTGSARVRVPWQAQQSNANAAAAASLSGALVLEIGFISRAIPLVFGREFNRQPVERLGLGLGLESQPREAAAVADVFVVEDAHQVAREQRSHLEAVARVERIELDRLRE